MEYSHKPVTSALAASEWVRTDRREAGKPCDGRSLTSELSGAAVQAVMACQLPEVYSMVDLLAYQLHDEGAALRFNSGGFQVVKPASSPPTRPPRSGRTSARGRRQCEVRWV